MIVVGVAVLCIGAVVRVRISPRSATVVLFVLTTAGVLTAAVVFGRGAVAEFLLGELLGLPAIAMAIWLY